MRPATEFTPARRIQNFSAPTVWHTFTPLAQQHKAVNLGQGFPGWDPPPFVRDACVEAIQQMRPDYNYMVNQYARSAGDLRLVTYLAKIYSRKLGLQVNNETEVLVTNGCTEAMFCVTQGLLEPGDEVIMFEPAFDIYMATVEMAGAKAVTVPLTPNQDGSWGFDMSQLARCFTPKTRMILINTPQNPTGKVFSAQELGKISALVQMYPNCICVADEVYENITFGDSRHLNIAALPGMWERTVTLSSAGKTFSITGWKIGWVIGPAHLVRAAAIAHQWVCFSVNTPAQVAIASALETAEKPYKGFESYYAYLRSEYTRKKNLMVDAVRAAGLTPYVPEGSFFIVINTERLQLPAEYLTEDIPHDWKVCKWLTKVIGVAAIPPSSFYSEENKSLASNFARLAFCKEDADLQEAGRRLLRMREFLKPPSKL